MALYSSNLLSSIASLISSVILIKKRILCIDNRDTAKRIVKYLEIDDIVLTKEDSIIDGKINLINKNINNGFIYICGYY